MYDVFGTIISILSEVLFIWFLIIRIKYLKRRQLILFVGIFFSYFIAFLLTSFNYNYHMYFYLVFNVIAFIIVKLLYRKEIYLIDFFLIGYIGFVLTLINLITFVSFNFGLVNYGLSFIISRFILIVVIFIVNNLNINKYYKKISNLWDRRDDGRIKAITVRNSVIIIMNLGLYLTNILLYVLLVGR